jgi:shikimate dehydrogenase
MNGLLMLVAQAKEASEWFTGRKIPDNVIPSIHAKLRRQMENMVLIGMPGCGKTTVGQLLAEKTGRKFVDADEEIIRLAGKPIPEIFAEDGESVFRNWETKVLAELGKQSGLVIATGGGCVTQERNYPLLHQNGTIFWLKRDLSNLPTDGRPLSQATSSEEMYRVRKPLYEAFADHIVENNDDLDATVNQILRIWEENL